MPLVVRAARKLLVGAGLSEDEADAFLLRLEKEFTAGHLTGEREQRRFLSSELAELKKKMAKMGGPSKLEDALSAIVYGILASAAWDGLKFGFDKAGRANRRSCA